MRISGLASGIDTETMVKELMQAERLPLNKLMQQKTYMEWQRDDYRDVNRKLKALSDKLFDGVMRQATYLQKNVSVSNPDAFSVRNISSTSDFSGTLSVNRLAKSASIVGTQTGVKPSDILLAEGEAPQDIKIRAIKADGTMQTDAEAFTFTIKPGETTLDSLIKEVNTKSGVTMFYDSFTGKISATAKNSGNVADGPEIELTGAIFETLGLKPPTSITGDSISTAQNASSIKMSSLQYVDDNGTTQSLTNNETLTINVSGADPILITYDATKASVQQVLDQINQAGVAASYDSATGQITLSHAAGLTVSGNTAKAFKLPDAAPIVVTDGENAEFTYNGLTTERPSNTFQLNGFEVTLKQETTAPVSFSSTPDTDKIFDSIKSFVDDYNKLIEELNGKISERKMRDFPPLTDEQRKEMSEDEVKLWDVQAKKGTLSRDTSISSGLNTMRTDLYSPVSGLDGFTMLADIGIKTSSNYLEKGKLEINEAKLKEAIAKDPDAIYKLFTADGATTEEKGLARRMRETIDGTIDKIEARAGKATSVSSNFTIGRNLRNIDSRIDSFENRLKQVEDRYWRQFTAMEKAIQQANSQSASLMSYFTGA